MSTFPRFIGGTQMLKPHEASWMIRRNGREAQQKRLLRTKAGKNKIANKGNTYTPQFR